MDESENEARIIHVILPTLQYQRIWMRVRMYSDKLRIFPQSMPQGCSHLVEADFDTIFRSDYTSLTLHMELFTEFYRLSNGKIQK